ncbi:uncharacterized protein BJ171DRAFT_208775 [Polychytrium aggregatum]|uniref:uncharacterized protein n=1 Tax=Polychytrium aggregatum TaxID=110093 RepID=UPI0022FED18D|nr:uncharacterized protein BJ171DRAFT_208775 [Polychytrium aggregatum]KAI9208498.1 hypothetical protein BJ171DRAFT_208775 [Polychytrium aggregatum]
MSKQLMDKKASDPMDPLSSSPSAPSLPGAAPQSQPSLKVGACFCCASLLRFPQTVSCFNCTICNTINDLTPTGPPKASHFGIALTLPLVHKLASDATKDQSKIAPLQNVLADSFSIFQFLNSSFANLQMPPSLQSTGLDTDSMDKTFSIISSLVTIVFEAILRLLKRPGRPIQKCNELQFLMIIIECPFIVVRPSILDDAKHLEVVARLLGLISGLANELHHFIVNWFILMPFERFQSKVTLVNRFIGTRMTRMQNFPSMYMKDWAIKAAARVMALLFAANAKRSQRLHVNEFYNTVVDYLDVGQDFWRWQGEHAGSFSFCQYPFLISLGSKIKIIQAENSRIMTEKFRSAYYRLTVHGLPADPFLTLRVRRNNLIHDSLSQLRAPNIDLRKKLKIEFANEAGIDAGGLTKEWFLLLVRDLFDPQYGMFVFEEESQLCWFNKASFENTEEFRLVGTILGLAISHGTILDVHFPLACYKKLLNVPPTFDDLMQLSPSIGRSFEQMLRYDADDFRDVFDLDFVVEFDRFGELVRHELIPNGASIPVTKDNVQEYINKYIEWKFTTSVKAQFDAFQTGFLEACGGNALSLLRPSEIEAIIIGETEIDFMGLETVTEYEGFVRGEPYIKCFWEIISAYSEENKRRFLMFVTGTDRIPPTGIQNMKFKLSCLGEDSDDLPLSHTCFNQLCLYRYSSRAKLIDKLEKAMLWSSGFHVK